MRTDQVPDLTPRSCVEAILDFKMSPEGRRAAVDKRYYPPPVVPPPVSPSQSPIPFRMPTPVRAPSPPPSRAPRSPSPSLLQNRPVLNDPRGRAWREPPAPPPADFRVHLKEHRPAERLPGAGIRKRYKYVDGALVYDNEVLAVEDDLRAVMALFVTLMQHVGAHRNAFVNDLRRRDPAKSLILHAHHAM